MSNRTEPVTLPDVATEPHPTGHTDVPPAGPAPQGGALQDALPAIHEAARRVGGYQQLADIARQLGETDRRK